MARRRAGLTLLEDQLTDRDGPDTAHRSPATGGDGTLEALGKMSETCDSMEQAGIAVLPSNLLMRLGMILSVRRVRPVV